MGDRIKVALVCDECGARNYETTAKRTPGKPERLSLKKFCPRCKRHTIHKESK
jgi:large subunit ribosomal protein L33